MTRAHDVETEFNVPERKTYSTHENLTRDKLTKYFYESS